jgi:hypothetical protein
MEGSVKQKLETIMKTFNLTQVATFPRTSNNKGTLIDSIFIDKAKYNNTSVYPFENGLSDHVAQILIVKKIKIPLQNYTYMGKTRIIYAESIANFQSYLREETWDSVYNSDDVNGMCNNFHCILIRHFENSFPITNKSYRNKYNNWITKGIRISCKRKRDFYTIYKHTNNIQVKEYYKKYCAILKKLIIDAKNYTTTSR